jgi:hypothetical protein
MKAMILYDGGDFARKAQVMLARAAQRANETTQWKVKPWRVNLLRWPGIAAVALHDAAKAHLIVLAIHHQAESSSSLLHWLERWARRRQIQDGALAVFDGGNGDRLSATAAPELSRFAQRHGLSFIFGDVDPAEEESGLFARSLSEREVAITPTVQQILQPAGDGYDHHWGTNA